jgi:hypothetical protein
VAISAAASGADSSRSGPSGHFSLSRAVAAIALEAKLDSDPYLGACQGGQPQLAGMPARACKPLYCLWSQAAQTNVDLWFHALTDLPPSAYPGRCPPPEGGQVGSPKDQQPEVGGARQEPLCRMQPGCPQAARPLPAPAHSPAPDPRCTALLLPPRRWRL